MALLNLYKEAHEAAVYENDKTYSYDEINVIVKKMSSYLVNRKIKKVAMLVEQGAMNYCLEWAAYLSGVTFCCYDIDAPLERILYCNQCFCPDLVVSNKEIEGINTLHFDDLLTETENINFGLLDCKNEVAYVLFTSGSTGQPKGVMIKRVALENVVIWAQKNYHIGVSTVYAQYSKNSFDLSVLDIFLGLSVGAKLVPFIGINKLLPGNLIRKYRISHWHSVPSAFVALQNRHDLTSETLASMKNIVFCGETLYIQLAENIFLSNPNVTVWNTYGPTEATIFCSSVKLTRETLGNFSLLNVSIGVPIEPMQFLIDSDTSEGELLIGGENIALGYINNPENQNFFEMKNGDHTLPIYRSGDIVKLENGNYYFVCRIDNQVKVAGNRFDLDEISRALHKAGYYNVASILVGNSIITFIQPQSGQDIAVEKIKTELEKQLPKYGVPTRILCLNEMPLNANGKIDKNKLKEIALNKGE